MPDFIIGECKKCGWVLPNDSPLYAIPKNWDYICPECDNVIYKSKEEIDA